MNKHQRHDEQRRRDPAYQERRRVYNSAAWKNARRFQLERSPICERCSDDGMTVPAVHVDHVVALAAGGDPFDANNLASLCAACHSRKTAAERSGGTLPEDRGCCIHGWPRDPEHPWNAAGKACEQCGTGGNRDANAQAILHTDDGIVD